MRRVFRAYVWRNPTVGYIQGIAFPFYRMRKWLSEEDVFWTLCIIVESYLPLDFYVEMYGATIHAKIFQKIFFQKNLVPDLLEIFERSDYALENLSARLYLSLFA
jgi:Rab-GTPase-TBC domain